MPLTWCSDVTAASNTRVDDLIQINLALVDFAQISLMVHCSITVDYIAVMKYLISSPESISRPFLCFVKLPSLHLGSAIVFVNHLLTRSLAPFGSQENRPAQLVSQ